MTVWPQLKKITRQDQPENRSDTERLSGINLRLQEELKGCHKLISDLFYEKSKAEVKYREEATELQREQARLKASIDSLNVGYIMIDTNMNIVMMNTLAASVLCLAPDDNGVPGMITGAVQLQCSVNEIQKNLYDNFDLISRIKECYENKKTINIKEVYYRDRYLHIFLSPIVVLKKQLEVIGEVILIEDITEAKILERAKNEFFTIASHELRTPLNAIRGNTAMILDYYRDRLPDEQIKEMVDDIHTASKNLISIVNDFLDSSRLELGKMVFQKEEVDLAPIIQDVFNQFSPFSGGLSFELIAPNSVSFRVIADRDKVRQVLVNLISNSVSFTKVGGIKVRLETADQAVKVQVADTGKGISVENQHLLFRKFQQAGDNIYTRDVTHGTGLGLYIAKLMVEGMGGKLWLEKSKENVGTVFAFTLPAAAEKDNES
jgi:signal transduction histidine kinase